MCNKKEDVILTDIIFDDMYVVHVQTLEFGFEVGSPA